jgi:hypothetical protein
MKPGERPPASPPNSGQPTRPHMWGATPCIEARACHKVRPTQRLGGQPKKRLDDYLRLDLCQNMRMPARRFPPPWSVEEMTASSLSVLPQHAAVRLKTLGKDGNCCIVEAAPPSVEIAVPVAPGAAVAMREVVILTLLCGTILIMAAAIAVHFVLQ